MDSRVLDGIRSLTEVLWCLVEVRHGVQGHVRQVLVRGVRALLDTLREEIFEGITGVLRIIRVAYDVKLLDG